MKDFLIKITPVLGAFFGGVGWGMCRVNSDTSTGVFTALCNKVCSVNVNSDII